ncbi:TetR/AcrR family transcriptional regulator [Thalassospira alkalitolerans]|uniref:TetR/AcrR family transcriptional regulator n=1 Tax=Thalassospira alkalitolerans TaxID=1293890 RepID=UPI003AA7C046
MKPVFEEPIISSIMKTRPKQDCPVTVRIVRKQVEKSAETRRRIMEATVRLLLRQGYSRLTTSAISKEAEVSRGAMTHHYDSKEDVVIAAIEYQLKQSIETTRKYVDQNANRDLSVDDIIDYLWRLMADGLFYMTLEYLPEMRHNAPFKTRLVPVIQGFHSSLNEIWAVISRRYNADPKHAEVVLNATMCLFRGMVAQTIVRSDPEYFDELLSLWRQLLRQMFATGLEVGNSPRVTKKKKAHVS